jgi:monoamine oxidase
MRVVVVGAGFAGLRAAQVLRAGGADVSIVEAGNRIGGRARTIRAPFAGGQYAESGAEWVDTHHHRVRALMDEFGLETEGAGQQWTTIRRFLFRNGALLAPSDLRRVDPELEAELDRYESVFEDLATDIVDPGRPDLHPSAPDVDALSAADIARRNDLGALASLFAQRNSQGEFAEEPARVSALFIAQQRAQARVSGADESSKAHRVRGGVQQIALSMADPLVPLLSTGEPVIAVRWSDTGVLVSTPRRDITADHVILACSLRGITDVVFDPPLPQPLATAIAELGYGTVTKTALQYPARSWPQGYATTEQKTQRVYEPTIDQPGAEGILMAYTGGDGGRRLATLTEAQRTRMVNDDVHDMYDLTEPPIGSFSRAWSTEPRYGGSYAAYGPGQVTAFWNVLRQPCGPIRLAGEHVASWTGYLEGALESGESVAAAILAAG